MSLKAASKLSPWTEDLDRRLAGAIQAHLRQCYGSLISVEGMDDLDVNSEDALNYFVAGLAKHRRGSWLAIAKQFPDQSKSAIMGRARRLWGLWPPQNLRRGHFTPLESETIVHAVQAYGSYDLRLLKKKLSEELGRTESQINNKIRSLRLSGLISTKGNAGAEDDANSEYFGIRSLPPVQWDEKMTQELLEAIERVLERTPERSIWAHSVWEEVSVQMRSHNVSAMQCKNRLIRLRFSVPWQNVSSVFDAVREWVINYELRNSQATLESIDLRAVAHTINHDPYALQFQWLRLLMRYYVHAPGVRTQFPSFVAFHRSTVVTDKLLNDLSALYVSR